MPDLDYQLNSQPPGLLTGVQQRHVQTLASLRSKGRVGMKVESLGVDWVSGFRLQSPGFRLPHPKFQSRRLLGGVLQTSVLRSLK